MAAVSSSRARVIVARVAAVALALGAVIAFAAALGGCRGCVSSPSSSPAPPAGGAAADLSAPSLACASMQGCVAACPSSGIAACIEACVVRLSPAARSAYEALEKCVQPACAPRGDTGAPCADPNGTACKLCVLSHCASQATSCLAH